MNHKTYVEVLLFTVCMFEKFPLFSFSGKYNASWAIPMMASKPRNISSSPTNLSPSRVQTLRTQGRSSGTNGGSKKGPSSPMSTGTAGRTPQTRRKELSVPQSQNSPLGSPKNHYNVHFSNFLKRNKNLKRHTLSFFYKKSVYKKLRLKFPDF